MRMPRVPRWQWVMYYRAWVADAATHSFGKADATAGLLGMVLPAVAHFYPQWKSELNSLAWEIPLCGLAALAAFQLYDGAIGFWLSDRQGKPINGGRGNPVAVGDVQHVEGPVMLCTAHALHATTRPQNWRGECLWLVSLHGEVQRDGDKMGALERRILAEL